MQEVFYKLVEPNRLLMPIADVTGWLFRVARNRITNLLRRKKPDSFSEAAIEDEDGELLEIEDLLPSPDAGPEALYVRHLLLDELELALDELPDEQRAIGGELVVHLWNWLLPTLFGWRQISFWQAIGLLALCRILFGGFGGRGFQRSNFRRRMAERWEQMTPEEREKFRQGLRGRWCRVAPQDSKPSA